MQLHQNYYSFGVISEEEIEMLTGKQMDSPAHSRIFPTYFTTQILKSWFLLKLVKKQRDGFEASLFG